MVVWVARQLVQQLPDECSEDYQSCSSCLQRQALPCPGVRREPWTRRCRCGRCAPMSQILLTSMITPLLHSFPLPLTPLSFSSFSALLPPPFPLPFSLPFSLSLLATRYPTSFPSMATPRTPTVWVSLVWWKPTTMLYAPSGSGDPPMLPLSSTTLRGLQSKLRHSQTHR